jgi:hypothetical protein
MRLLIAIALAAAVACTPRLTRFRGGLSDCTAVALDNDAILCHGKAVAKIECFLPRAETCTALAVHYPDGERVFLYEPALFDPAHPENSQGDTHSFAQRPQIAEDASMIWFKRSDARAGNWEAYELDTGALHEMDTRTMFYDQQRRGSRPLWTLAPAVPDQAQ